MFNQVRLELQPSRRACALLLTPSLFVLILATAANESSVWALALAITLCNAWYAYLASVRFPADCTIDINNKKLQLINNHDFMLATFEEQLWLGTLWGLVRVRQLSEPKRSILIFLSPLTVRNQDELRRLKVHATHNKQFKQATSDSPL